MKTANSTVTLYEVEVLCPNCNERWHEVRRSNRYYYSTCEHCRCMMAKRTWGDAKPIIVSTICENCGKPIEPMVAYKFGNRCEDCWYEDAQERQL